MGRTGDSGGGAESRQVRLRREFDRVLSRTSRRVQISQIHCFQRGLAAQRDGESPKGRAKKNGLLVKSLILPKCREGMRGCIIRNADSTQPDEYKYATICNCISFPWHCCLALSGKHFTL